MSVEEDHLNDRIPTRKELEEIRFLIEKEARFKWLWSTLKTWILAIMTAITLFTVGFDGIKSILRKLVS
jgi:hypothetical protein